MGKTPTADFSSEQFDFHCIQEDCSNTVAFSVGRLAGDATVLCKSCGCEYKFQAELVDKFQRFAALLKAVQNTQDILGDINVGIQVEGHSVKIPYRLLLTRLNTMITLQMGGQKVDFHVRVHPLADLEKPGA
jgi:transcription elongation factor Elf1